MPPVSLVRNENANPLLLSLWCSALCLVPGPWMPKQSIFWDHDERDQGREAEIVQTDQSKVNGHFCCRLLFQLFVTFNKVHGLDIIIFGHFFHIWLWPRAMSFGKIEAKIPSAVCEHCKHPPKRKKSFSARRNNNIAMFSFSAQMTPKQPQRFQTWLVISP